MKISIVREQTWNRIVLKIKNDFYLLSLTCHGILRYADVFERSGLSLDNANKIEIEREA